MIEYTKIPCIYQRDTNGSKSVIEGAYTNETVAYLADKPWIMTEKIDGTNISVCWDGHRVTFHGRTERAQVPSPLVNKLNELFGGTEAEELFEQKFGSTPIILYGEGYGAKIQKGGSYIPDGVDFILFDALIHDNFQPRSAVEDIAKTFGINVVPVLFTGTLEEGVKFVKAQPKSTFGTAMMEGIVARPFVELNDRCHNRVLVKIKVKDFL